MNLNAWLPRSEYDPALSKNKTVCSRLDVSNTVYGQVNWPSVLTDANNELILARSQFANGSVVKLHRRRNFHLVINGELCGVPDYDTLTAMGLGQEKIKNIKLYNFLKFLKFGNDFPKIALR